MLKFSTVLKSLDFSPTQMVFGKRFRMMCIQNCAQHQLLNLSMRIVLNQLIKTKRWKPQFGGSVFFDFKFISIRSSPKGT